jgi:hypothetical protein
MKSSLARLTLGLALAALVLFSVGCGSSPSSNPNPNPQPQNGTVNLFISDASTEDWATIGIRVLSVTLTPQGGGTDVTIYTAPNPAPVTNLLQLDQLAELIGNPTVPVGTYTKATITVSGNPGDVTLITSSDPEVGFAAAANTVIPTSQIQIKNTQGSSGSLTVPIKVTLVTPIVVTDGQNSPLDLEFDLSHPAFIVAHVPPAAGTTFWAVNFNGPCRHHPLHDLTHLLLRHIYGTANSVSSDNTTLFFFKDFPVYPPTNPETEITSTLALSVLADKNNGTLFYDVDLKTPPTKIYDFSSIASTIGGRFIRVAARYQVDGSLVAVRLWASNTFNSVWISPEGHVLHVIPGNGTTGTLVVENELGLPVPLTIDANTLFYFRTPANAQTDANFIGQGPGFLSNLVRGFKVHCSVVDPLAASFVANSIDIEIARYDGTISASNPNNFTYTRKFHTASDDYTVTLPYININTPNGYIPGTTTPIDGFKWWYFTFPTIVDSGSDAASDFATATGGAVNFEGSVGQFYAAGETFATWNDMNAPNAWAAPWTVVTPTQVPIGIAATGYSLANSNFMLSVPGGLNNITVDLDTTSGSASLVYQVDCTNNVVTISPVDISNSTGQQTLSTNLLANTPVKVYGVPQVNGTIKDYVLFYFTGVAPSPTALVN